MKRRPDLTKAAWTLSDRSVGGVLIILLLAALVTL